MHDRLAQNGSISARDPRRGSLAIGRRPTVRVLDSRPYVSPVGIAISQFDAHSEVLCCAPVFQCCIHEITRIGIDLLLFTPVYELLSVFEAYQPWMVFCFRPLDNVPVVEWKSVTWGHGSGEFCYVPHSETQLFLGDSFCGFRALLCFRALRSTRCVCA